MRDVLVSAIIYSVLFIILTTPIDSAFMGMSEATARGLHYLLAELVFWAAALYICASGTYGAFARQDRFALSRNHPLVSRILSLILLASPFLAVLVNVRFVFVMLGLLLFSHIRSKTENEKNIEFGKSRAFSNLILLVLFTLALMLMNTNDYHVYSVFDFGAMNPGKTAE